MSPNLVLALTAIVVLLFDCKNGHAKLPELTPGDGPTAFDQVQFWVGHKLYSEEYEFVDEAIAKYSDLSIRALDGRPMLSGVGFGIDTFSKKVALDPSALEQVAEWRKKSPSSITAILVEASIWKNAAWAARGPGMAASVSEEGWKMFRSRLAKAESLLLDSRTSANFSPLWYGLYLDVLLGLGRSDSEMYAVFHEGSSRFPDYYPIYFAYLLAQLPQWSGSTKRPGEVISQITAKLKPEAAAVLYTRMFWYAQQAGQFRDDRDIFGRDVDWKRMKKGFDLLLAQFPNSIWNASNLMGFACKADDKETYEATRAKLGSNADKYVAEINVDPRLCEHKFKPRSEVQRRYESVFQRRNQAYAELHRACSINPRSPETVEVILTSFQALIDSAREFIRIEKEERPESPIPIPVPVEPLEKADSSNTDEICRVLRFGS